jgi:hypothetical protein
MKGLKNLHHLKIPRWIGYSKTSIVSAEIHVFGTRVAPLPKKKVTLPRLELEQNEKVKAC